MLFIEIIVRIFETCYCFEQFEISAPPDKDQASNYLKVIGSCPSSSHRHCDNSRRLTTGSTSCFLRDHVGIQAHLYCLFVDMMEPRCTVGSQNIFCHNKLYKKNNYYYQM